MEKRWARLAVQAQCRGVLDFGAPPDKNGLGALREELLLAVLEREQSVKAVQLMLLAQIAQRGNSRQLVMALLDEGLANLQGTGAGTSGLPAIGALDEKQLEQWYTKVRDTHRKKKKQRR